MKSRALISLKEYKKAHIELVGIEEKGQERSEWQQCMAQSLEGLGQIDEANMATEKFKQLKKKEEQYVATFSSDEYISVAFYIEKERILKIGEKLNEINENAYMNGYNWEALLRYYIGRQYPEVEEHLEHNPEAGMYVGYFKNTPENEKLATKLFEIITELVENEDKLYDLVRHEGTNIQWD